MRVKFKKSLCLALALLTFLTVLVACKNAAPQLNDRAVSHEEKFGGIYVEIAIDDFNALGFAFGDSLTVTFSNGYVLDDLPYYSGYYTDTGEPLLVGYPGYPYVRAGINNGDDLWNIAGLTTSDTATIKLKQRAKYLDVQQAMDIHYTDEQGEIPDIVFANFRAVNSVAALKENVLYRSASPVDNSHNRAHVVDGLISGKVNTIVNLSDDDAEIAAHIAKDDFDSPYFLSVYEGGGVIALSMSMNYKEERVDGSDKQIFSDKLVAGLRFMLDREGPYLVHCVEGKDRTGFVCMVVEALVGATYDEMVADYMITYDNYYGINLRDEPSKYSLIKQKNIDEILRTIIGEEDVAIETADYASRCEAYLISKGMTRQEVVALREKLAK